MKKKILAGFVAASAIVGLTASPAFAEQFDVAGTQWDINSGSKFGVDQYSQTEKTAPYGAYSGDDIYLILDDPSSPGNDLTFDCSGVSDTLQADGDFFVECDNPANLLGGNLTWDGDITIFTGEYRGIVGRVVYTLTNTTSSNLTLDLRYKADTEECNVGDNVATSSGNIDTEPADSWLVCENDNDALESFAWGNNWMTSFVTDYGIDSCDVCVFKNDDFVLAANSSATFVFFLYSEGSTNAGNAFGDTEANIIAKATSYFDVTTLGASRLWEGLTTADNWNNVVGSGSGENSDTPSLPDTGVDAGGLLLAAAALLGLGAVIVVRRRSARA